MRRHRLPSPTGVSAYMGTSRQLIADADLQLADGSVRIHRGDQRPADARLRHHHAALTARHSQLHIARGTNGHVISRALIDARLSTVSPAFFRLTVSKFVKPKFSKASLASSRALTLGEPMTMETRRISDAWPS